MRAIIAIALLACSGTSRAQWMQMPDFPGTARDDAAAFAIEDKVYVGTGMEVGWGLTNDWYRFDGSTAQWSPIAPLPATPRQYCSAFTLPYPDDMHGYLFGGLDANGPLNELWRYDPAMDSWTQMASLPGAARYAAASLGGGFIATGLLANGTATSELWRYNPTTDSWEQLASMPGTPRHRACGSNWTGHMVIGGADADYNALADCWSYDALSGTWSVCASLPEGRYGAMCGFAAYSFLLIGGALNASTIVETVLDYNVTSWLPSGDPHPGGTRRGGIMIEAAGNGPGVSYSYIGLGLSNDLTRHADWYMSSSAFSVPDRTTGTLAIHPNPANDRIHIGNAISRGPCELTLFDGLGKPVQQYSAWSPEEPVIVSHLPPGTYVMRISANGQIRSARFIKLP